MKTGKCLKNMFVPVSHTLQTESNIIDRFQMTDLKVISVKVTSKLTHGHQFPRRDQSPTNVR